MRNIPRHKERRCCQALLLRFSMALPQMASGLDDGRGLQKIFPDAPQLFLQCCSMGPLLASGFSKKGAEHALGTAAVHCGMYFHLLHLLSRLQ